MNRQDRDRGAEMWLTERTRKLIPERNMYVEQADKAFWDKAVSLPHMDGSGGANVYLI